MLDDTDMSVGQLARLFLGKKHFSQTARYYRSIFVDLKTVANHMSPHIPENAHILDIGGGDGEPLNYLLAIRQDINVTMIDLHSDIGYSILKQYRQRVTLLPKTSIRQFINQTQNFIDSIIISDVIHHIPQQLRPQFFNDLLDLMSLSHASLLIKDVEPGYFLAKLGYFCDFHISGDKNTNLISKTKLASHLKTVFKTAIIKETDLFLHDCPNYLLLVTLSQFKSPKGASV